MASVPTTRAPKGFTPWWISPPPLDATSVAYWRLGMIEPDLIDRQSIHPQWNIYGVYWAPASALSAPVTKAIN